MKAEHKKHIKDAINSFGLEYSYNKDMAQSIEMASDFLDTENQLNLFEIFLAEFVAGKESIGVERIKDPDSELMNMETIHLKNHTIIKALVI